MTVLMTTSTSPTTARTDYFATTRWTVVVNAGQAHAVEAEKALEELCRTYWYPLYAYVRRRGHSKEDAEDLTQSFFERFLRGNYLEEVSSEKGRFRAFLLAALKHFLANARDYSRRLKRGGGTQTLALDWQSAAERYHIEPANELSPDKLYDRAWAVTLLESVISRLGAENAAEGKGAAFEHLRPFLMLAKGEIPYAQTAGILNLSEGAVRVAVHRLRRRYRELLREEIRRTLSDPATLEQEMRVLMTAFTG